MNNRPGVNEIKKYGEFWHRSALDNLASAKAMLVSKRYNFAMFLCQQTVEAILKSAIVIKTGERPAYLHKLPRLLVLTGVEVPSWVDKIILRVDAHYIKARYFEDRFDTTVYNRKNAAALIRDTERVLEWFAKELRSKE